LCTHGIAQLTSDVVQWYEQCSPADLRIDLGCIEFIDGRGVSLLVDLVRRARPRGGVVRIHPASSCAVQLFDICGLRSLVDPTSTGTRTEPTPIG
jgi:anti-anti-sigma factor